MSLIDIDKESRKQDESGQFRPFIKSVSPSGLAKISFTDLLDFQDSRRLNQASIDSMESFIIPFDNSDPYKLAWTYKEWK